MDLLDKYLDQADATGSEADWTAVSRSAEDLVLAKWESDMLTLADAGIDYGALKDEARTTVETEIENRLSVWLLDRFFATDEDLDWTGIIEQISGAKIASLFELDGAGMVRLDSEGDPIRRASTGEDEFETGFMQWKSNSNALAAAAVADWNTRATQSFNELLSGFSVGRRASLEASCRTRLADMNASKRREVDAMLRLEESNYRYLGLLDQYSLRLESEGTSAEAVADSLIEKTSAELDESIKSLLDSLDGEAGEVSLDGRQLDGDEWQEQFRNALETGLAQWQRAGEEFLARRISWEQQAGKDLSSGIDAWNQALRDLQDKESVWLDRFREIRERAEAKYDQRFAEIEDARKKAEQELQTSIAANQANLGERIEVMVGMLNQSIEMMRTARDGVDYWISKTQGNGGFSIDATAWDAPAMRKEVLSGMFTSAIVHAAKIDLSAMVLDDRKPSAFAAKKVAENYKAKLMWIMLTGKGDFASRVASATVSSDYSSYRAIVEDYYKGRLAAVAEEAYNEALATKLGDFMTEKQAWNYFKSSFDTNWAKSHLQSTNNQYDPNFDPDCLINSGSTYIWSYGDYIDTVRASALSFVLSDSEIAALRAQLESTIKQATNNTVKNALDPKKTNTAGSDGEAFTQALYWIDDVYAGYEAEAKRQNEELTKSYGLVVFEGKTIPSTGYATEQTIAGPIATLTDKDNPHGWESLYLDAYQVDLLQAQAIERYWEKEYSVAKAVYDYSKDGSSTRATEAATLASYESSLADYRAALATYQTAIDGLKAVDGALNAKNAAIEAIKTRLNEKKEALAEAKDRYAQLLVLAELKSPDYYAGQFRSYYEALARLRGASDAAGSVAKGAESYASSAASYSSAAFTQASSSLLEELIGGNDEPGAEVASLAEVKKAYDARATYVVRASDIDDPAFLETVTKALSLSRGEPWYERIDRAIGEYTGMKIDKAALSSIIETAAKTLAAESAGELERRMMSVRLLLARNSGEAYASPGDLLMGQAAVTSVADTLSALETAKTQASRKLLSERLVLEIGALEELLSQMDAYRNEASNPSKTLSGFAAASPGADASAARRLAWNLDLVLGKENGLEGESLFGRVSALKGTLVELKTILDAPMSEADRVTALKARASSDGTILGYLSGKTAFSSDGVDFAIPYLSDAYAKTVALEKAADDFKANAAFAPVLQAEARVAALKGLSDWLTANDLGSVEGDVVSLQRPTEIWSSFTATGAPDALDRIAALNQGAEAALNADGIPAHVREALSSWLSEVSNLLLLKSMKDYGVSGITATTLESDAKALEESAEGVSADMAAYFDETSTPERRAVACLRLKTAGVAFSASAEDAAIDALAASFCRYRLAVPAQDFTGWEASYDAWFTSVKAEDLPDSIKTSSKSAIIAAATFTWEKASLSANPSGYDYAGSANAATLDEIKLVEAIRALPLEVYLQAFAAGKDDLARKAVSLHKIDRYLETAAADSPFSVKDALAAICFSADANPAAAATAYIAAPPADDVSETGVVYALLCDFIGGFSGTVPVNPDAASSFSGFAAGSWLSDEAGGDLAAAAMAAGETKALLGALYHASLADALSGYAPADAAGALALVRSITGIAANPAIDQGAFADMSADERAIAAYSLDPRAFRYALKSFILSGKTIDAYLATASASVKAEIGRFEKIAKAVMTHVEPFDGDFSAYLATDSGAGLDAAARDDAVLLRQAGSYDDAFFEPGTAPAGLKAYLDAAYELASRSVSAIARYRALDVEALYRERAEKADVAYYRAELASDYLALEKVKDGAWRQYLGTAGIMTDSTTAGTLDDTSIKKPGLISCITLVDETPSDVAYSQNAYVNAGLESAARLKGLSFCVESLVADWAGSDFAADSGEYLGANRALAEANPLSGALPDAFASFTATAVDYETESEFAKARETFYGLLSQGRSIAGSMASLGKTVDEYIKNEDNSTAKMTAATKADINRIQGEIGEIKVEWAKAVGVPGAAGAPLTEAELATASYAELEGEYSRRYKASQEAFEALEAEKQESKIAKAIYDYASTPYLRVTGSVTSSGDEATLAALKTVDPDTRLAEISDNRRRATAARAALQDLYKESAQRTSLYESDAEYQKLKNAYTTEYRRRLAALQAQALIEAEVKTAQAQFNKAKDNYETAVKKAAKAPTTFAATKNEESGDLKTVHNWLESLKTNASVANHPQLTAIIDSMRIVNGEVTFDASGTPRTAAEEAAIARYFTRDEDATFSAFETALDSWMRRNKDTDHDRLTNALSWEEFERAGGMTLSQYSKAHPAHEVQNEGYQGTHIETEYEVRTRYLSSIKKIVEQNLLRDYGGTTDDGATKRALWLEIISGDVIQFIDRIHNAHEKVKDLADYDFYKMLVLFDVGQFDNGFSTMESTGSFVNGDFAHDFYKDASGNCHHKGAHHVARWNREKWYRSSDRCTTLKNSADKNYANKVLCLKNAEGALAKLWDKREKARQKLIEFTGVDPDTGAKTVSFDTLLDAIMKMSDPKWNKATPVNDILKTAGVDFAPGDNSSKKRALLSTVLTSDGAVKVSGSFADIGQMMGAIASEHGKTLETASDKLDAHLYASATGGKDAGIAVRQQEAERAYAEAYAAFVARGIIPSGSVNKQKIENWENAIGNARTNFKTGIAAIAGYAKDYLADTEKTEGEDRAISNLRLAWDSYLKAKASGVGVDDANALLANTFSTLASAYRAGADWQTALAAAYDRTKGGYVYDAREDAIRTYENYSKVSTVMSTEKSYLRTVARDEVIESMRASLFQMNQNRLAAYYRVRMGEWDILTNELALEKKHFNEQMDAILTRGVTEWQRAENAVISARDAWATSFEKNFDQKETAWDAKYYAFIEKKKEWAKDLTAQSVYLGDQTILNRIPTLTEDYIREATDFIVSDVIEAPNPACLVSDILDESLLSGLLSEGSSIGKGVAGFSPVIFQTLRRANYTDAEILNRVREYQTREDDELQARLAYIQYDKAMETLKDARSQVESAINDSNRSTWKGFHDMFIEDGFRKENDNYIKRTVVGATLLDSITETHTIKSYENFKTDIRDFTKDFAMPQGLDYTTIGFEGMQALLKQAMDSVPTEYARIFGERDDDGNWKNAKYEKQYMKNEPYEKPMVRYDLATQQNVFYTVEKTRSIPTVETLDYNSYVTYQKALEDLSDDERGEKGQNERIVVTGNGLFTEWVGYAPVMKPGADPGVDVEDYQKNVRFDGSGQTGRIMGMYIQHKMIEGAGWAECELPAYNRRLWDDRGSWMKAPTIRSLADVAMNIAATAFAPGVGQIMLNLVDDAVFTMLDVANGMDPLAAAEGLVKKAATSYATGRINFGFANGGGILNSQLLGKGVIGETLTKGLQIGMTNVASSTINAFSISSLLDGGPLFDGDAFMEGAFGKSAMTSVAAGMAGHAVTGGLGKIDLSDANKQALYGGVFKTGSLESFNGFMGSMAGSAVTYGMTGNATFNLAKIGGVGVMEMHLGKDGFQMNLGMNGTDVSLGTVARAARGASEAMKVVDWKYGTLKERATLNGINVMGWTGEAGNDFNVALSKAIWERKANVRYEKMAGNGYYDQGTNTVAISNEFLGSGLDAAAKLATVMSHEGKHLAGSRVEGVAHEQGNLTYNQITAMFGLPADTAFSKSMVDAINNPESWKENTGTRDNWLVKNDGTVVDDGSADWHWEAVNKGTDANPIYKTIKSANGATKEESLVVGLGGDEKAKQMLASKGVSLNGSETSADLGALVVANFSNPAVAGALNIDFSDFSLGRDYRAIYNSYSAHQGFIDSQVDITKGRADLLLAGNGGEAITTKLEYYTLLYDQYVEQPEIAGSAYANDPAGYLVENLTTVSGHGLSKDIVINKAIENALTDGLDRTAMYGGLIPPVDGGFSMRFMNNKDLEILKLSEHAMGFAVDFDPEMNDQYFVPDDKYLDSYLAASLGKNPAIAKGYSDQKPLSNLIAGYGDYLTSRQNILATLYNGVSSYGMPQGYQNMLQRQLKAEQNVVSGIIQNLDTYPTTSFSMGSTFVNTMRMHMNWGGDWWRQKDYMHFERKH